MAPRLLVLEGTIVRTEFKVGVTLLLALSPLLLPINLSAIDHDRFTILENDLLVFFASLFPGCQMPPKVRAHFVYGNIYGCSYHQFIQSSWFWSSLGSNHR